MGLAKKNRWNSMRDAYKILGATMSTNFVLKIQNQIHDDEKKSFHITEQTLIGGF
jgi:hypothetical protein